MTLIERRKASILVDMFGSEGLRAGCISRIYCIQRQSKRKMSESNLSEL